MIAPERSGRRRVPRALPARVRGGGVDPAPERDPDLPRGRGGRAAVRDDALRRRATTSRGCWRRETRLEPVRAAMLIGAGRGGARRRARARARPPRRQAREHPASSARRARARAADRLRADQEPAVRHAADRDGHGHRHVRLHRARAARRRARSTRAPTSTRSAACSTRRSRAASRTRARRARRRCSRTSRRRRRRSRRSSRRCREALDGVVAHARWPRTRRSATRRRGELARAALAAVDRPSLPRRRRLDAGVSPSGWSWPAMPRSRRRVPLPPALHERDRRRRVRRPRRARSRGCARATQRAAAGARQFVLLAGEPGIGKTRLATELAREAHAAGATVLYGRSDAESLVPYQPFVTAIQHYMAHRDTLDVPARARARAGRARALRPRAAPPAARAARAGRRGRRDAPLPAVRGGHAACSRASPREHPDGADPRRPAVGGHVDRAAARAHAAGPRADAAARASPRCASRRRPRGRAARRCSRACAASRRSSGSRSSGLDATETRALVAAAPTRERERLVHPARCRTGPRATRSSSRRRCAAWSR